MEHSTTLSLGKKSLVVGIDEAGRGSLVGDMFIAGVCVSEEKIQSFKELGVRDSKELTPKKREKLFENIVREIEYYTIRRIPPSKIDERNLNDLLYESITNIIIELLGKYNNISRIYIDLTGNKRRLLSLIARSIKNKHVTIIAEYKADQKYTVVSIASIIAKVLRDKHIRELSVKYGEIGSGYPADPKTINWLQKYIEKHGTLPPIVRRTWRTIKDIAPSYYINKHSRNRKTLTLDSFLKDNTSKK